MKKYDVGLGVFFVLVGSAMFVNAGTLPPAESGIGSGFWPRILAVMLIGLSVLMILKAVVAKPASDNACGDSANSDVPPIDFSSPGVKRVLFSALVLAVFFLIMYLLGFLIASFFLIPAVMMIMGERRKLLLVGMAAGVVVLVYVIFVMILHLPLPSGLLF